MADTDHGFNQPDALRRDVLFFLACMRQSIDVPFRVQGEDAYSDFDKQAEIMLSVESARIRFNLLTRVRGEPSASRLLRARDLVIDFIDSFVHSDTDPELFDRRFRMAIVPNRERDNPSLLMRQLRPEDHPIIIADALMVMRRHLAQFAFTPERASEQLSFTEFTRTVPDQQLAPVQFEFRNGRLSVAHSKPNIEPEDAGNIQSALQHIQGSGENLLHHLDNSNCDRRLLDTVRELHEQITSGNNIVRIGLTNIACGVMGAQFHTELPDAIVGMFNAYNVGISMYVAQFPEWEQFTRKAGAIDIDDDDISEVNEAALEIVAALTEAPDLADPEVPRTIEYVRTFLALPGHSAKRAAYALIRTVENLVSGILRHVGGFIEKTSSKTVELGSTVASHIIVGLLGVALIGAIGVGAAAMHTGSPWVKQAVEIVQQQILKAAE